VLFRVLWWKSLELNLRRQTENPAQTHLENRFRYCLEITKTESTSGICDIIIRIANINVTA
jgi:hypothetical protein